MFAPFRSNKTLAFTLGVFLFCPLALAQNTKTGTKDSKPDKDQLTFKVPVDVVVVTATVTDKQGKPVRDLTAEDFKLYEDGKPQAIHTFSLEAYETMQSLEAAGGKPAAAGGRPAIAAAGELASRPVRPRMFSFMIDDVTSTLEYYPATIEAIRKFVTEDMAPGDQVAIYSGSGSVQHAFSDDRQLLLAEIGSLQKKLGTKSASKSDCPKLTDLQAQRIARQWNDIDSMNVAVLETYRCMLLPDDTPMSVAQNIVRAQAFQQFQDNQYRNRILLQTLRQHVRSLRHFEAQKNVILFSDGFLFEDLLYELQDAVDQALRAGVVLNTVDMRGLYVPMFDASQSSIGSVSSGLSHLKQQLLAEDMSAQEEPLFQMAHDTGGIFLRNNNDLREGPRAVAERETSHYVLSYASPAIKADGRYHKIKLEVSRPGVELSYRDGYYAPKEQLSFERRKKEDILEALRAPGNVNEIPVRLSFNSSQLDDTRYEVELVAHVDVRRLQFAEEDSRRRNLISLVIVAFDENGRYVDGVQKDVSFNLTPSSYSDLLDRGFASQVTFRMPPGRYKIRTVIRESVRTKMGALTKSIEIP